MNDILDEMISDIMYSERVKDIIDDILPNLKEEYKLRQVLLQLCGFVEDIESEVIEGFRTDGSMMSERALELLNNLVKYKDKCMKIV